MNPSADSRGLGGYNVYVLQVTLEMSKGPIKLKPISSLPDASRLLEMLRSGEHNGFSQVSMSIRLPETEETFLVQVNWPVDDGPTRFAKRRDGGIPLWTFTRSDSTSTTTLWSHHSNDVGLIETMILQEFPEPEPEPTVEEPKVEAPPALTPQEELALKRAQATPTQVNFTGNLQEMDLSNLLQSLAICQINGRLQLTDRLEEVHVYFEDGTPTHAMRTVSTATGESIEECGDKVMLEILTWNRGEFQFVHHLKSREKSIKKRMGALLMEGVALRDQFLFLKEQGLTDDAAPYRADPSLTEHGFEAKVAQGIPIDLRLQKWLYQQIDGTKTMNQIVAASNLEKTHWVPALYNLINCEVVAMHKLHQVEESAVCNELLDIDKSAVEKVGSELARQESGFLTYPLFLHFLMLECSRSSAIHTPFAVIVFEINHDDNGQLSPLSNTELRELISRIKTVIVNFDVAGHCQSLDFALLLPYRTKETAAQIAHQIANLASGSILDPLNGSSNLVMSFGIAGCPENGDSSEQILSAALDAKRRARKIEGNILSA